MEHKQKLEQWFKFVEVNRVKKYYKRPPIDLLLQKMGIEQPPMFFWSFRKTFIVMGIYSTLSWGLLMYFIIWRMQNISPTHMISASLFFGVFMGVFIAWQHSRARKKYGLTTWKNFAFTDTRQN